MMTAREVFDKVAKHLLDQGKVSKMNQGCAYRSSDGLTCAVGCLIPDDVYDTSMEGKNVHSITYDYAPLRDLFGDHIELLTQLQQIHDCGQVERWEDQLERIKP